VVLLAALVLGRTRPDLSWRPFVSRDKVLEGDEIEIGLDVTSRSSNFEIGFLVDVPTGTQLVEPPRTVLVNAGSEERIRGRMICHRWGAWTVGGGVIQARDLASAFIHEITIESPIALRAYPRPEQLRSMLRPHSLKPRFGGYVSRVAGVGLEFADIRQFAHGDQRRHINWKATARQGRLHVDLFHPERSADLVLVLDTFTDVAGGKVSSLDMGIRALTAAAIQCLRRRDRVGLLSIGGTVQWLLPGTGIRQLYRIIDSLLRTQLVLNYAWPDTETIPSRALPAGALIVALSPLADRRTATILLDLHSRGHDVSVVEIAADALLPQPVTEREQLARRLWTLHREAVRSRFRELGLPVAQWEPGEPLQIPFVELERFRRSSRRLNA
jgi:uncharacterized protein (DUF58 family)